MKHKTWFRLALKLVGIYLLATSIPAIINVAATMIARGRDFAYWSGGSVVDLDRMIAVAIQFGLVGSILQSAIGIYLLLGAGMLASLIIPSSRPYCPDCGHELRGISGVNCPECGTRLPTDLLPPPAPPASAELTDGDESSPIPPTPMMRRVIPLGNRKALLAYYLAVASLLPVLGILLGPVAVTYGIEGLRHARRSPPDGGRAHGWVAIILGSSTTLLNLIGLCLSPALILR